MTQHSGILHFREHKVDHAQLQSLERWCIGLRSDYPEYREYSDAPMRGAPTVYEALWYHIRYQSGSEEIVGYICAPKDYLEKDYPMLIYSRGSWGGDGINARNVQYTARFGFIVLAAAYRGGGLGSTGKDGFGGEDVNDVIKLIDLADEFTFTNEKMYMFG